MLPPFLGFLPDAGFCAGFFESSLGGVGAGRGRGSILGASTFTSLGGGGALTAVARVVAIGRGPIDPLGTAPMQNVRPINP